MELTGQDIREYIQKKAEEKKPQDREGVMRILDEVFHELKASGKIRRDADLHYWEEYFAQRWEQFLKEK